MPSNNVRRPAHTILSAPLHLGSPSRKVIDDTYDQFGPTPRLCLEMASDPHKLESYKAAVHRALKWATLQNPLGLILELKCLNMDDNSEKLFLIRRENKGEVKSMNCVAPITDYIRFRLAITMWNDG